MTVDLLLLRKTELQRRTKELPEEVARWKTQIETQIDMNLHSSQIAAVQELSNAYRQSYDAIIAGLPAETDKPAYELALYKLLNAIASAQRAWDFFRRKFELRNSERFKMRLRVADIVAIDCYDAAIEVSKAKGWVAPERVREPPLTYLSPDISPLTWARGSRPNDGRTEELEGQRLPIPVVEIPYDHLANIWEMLSIAHEVGHEIDADLKLLPAIKANLTAVFNHTAVTPERLRRWTGWSSEIFPDLLALQFSGPAFVYMLRNVLILPFNSVTNIVLGDVHPNHYLRIMLCTAYIRSMGEAAPAAGSQQFRDQLNKLADDIEADWMGLYGTPAALADYLVDIPTVIKAVMDTPIPTLNGATLRSVVDYTPAHETAISDAATELRGRRTQFAVAPRHAIAAARMAIQQALEGGTLDQEIDVITASAISLIEFNAPREKRGPGDPLSTDPSARTKRAADFVIQQLSMETPLHQRMVDPWT